MKTDDMLGKIREAHPGATTTQPGPTWPWYVVNAKGEQLSEARSRGAAVLAAYRAVRKARPKPMTVAQAEAFVKARHAKATWNAMINTRAGKQWFTIWDGVNPPQNGPEPAWGKGETIGQAWKVAAAAIRASDGGNP